jgi:hypothetical protein
VYGATARAGASGAKEGSAVKSSKAHARLKRKLLDALKLGTGSLLLATSVAVAPAADAAQPPAAAPVLERAAALRSQLMGSKLADTANPTQLAWWGNWHNWGWHPAWHNWPNWHNWHNWANWHNY